jgi:predicted SAM-dependent methyltransferase
MIAGRSSMETQLERHGCYRSVPSISTDRVARTNGVHVMKCPFCLFESDEFLSYGAKEEVFEKYQIIGGGYRKNVICPSCGSMDRERLLYLYLKELPILKNEDVKLLHMAPESSVRKFLSGIAKVEYITADNNRADVEHYVDITEIDEPDNAFDMIICNHVLEHVYDDRKAMTELNRVLQPDGLAILQVPISKILETTYEDSSIKEPTKRLRQFGQEDHVRIYGQDYTARLENAGFSVTSVEWWNNASKIFGSDNEYGLIEMETLFECSKRSR